MLQAWITISETLFIGVAQFQLSARERNVHLLGGDYGSPLFSTQVSGQLSFAVLSREHERPETAVMCR